MKQIETDRILIAQLADERQEENDQFRSFINQQDGQQIDDLVANIYPVVDAQVDCTACGACCKQLMVNITPSDADRMSDHLQLSTPAFKEKFVEEGRNGIMIMNTIPCHFLAGTKCSAYGARFTECREFPDLHKGNFKSRLFATLIHYAMCPIIYNVVEELKEETGFERVGNC